ncbi:MAG TPA: hypothetical protein VI461_03490 [Chitinophagaceae bacterium]|nr:hypothetical protein [Chitinophagaceae bacterium]
MGEKAPGDYFTGIAWVQLLEPATTFVNPPDLDGLPQKSSFKLR